MTARIVTLVGYALLALSLVAWEIISVRRRSLTLGRLVRWITGFNATRWALFLGWAWLGWHFFVRGTVTFLAH